MAGDRLQDRLARRLAERARVRAQRAILNMATDTRRGRSLRRAMRVVRDRADNDDSSFFVEIPFFWAVYYHDGRGPIRARPGKYLAFFKNPLDDPRIRGLDYPVRATQARSLRETVSRAEFRRLVRSGKLILAQRVGPAPSHKFFEQGMGPFVQEVGGIAMEEMTREVRECLGDLLEPPPETARLRIR